MIYLIVNVPIKHPLGLVNVQVKHHPTSGDIISSRYLEVMFRITKHEHLPTLKKEENLRFDVFESYLIEGSLEGSKCH